MKQWGTLSLANQGYTAIEILRYYYGDSILIRAPQKTVLIDVRTAEEYGLGHIEGAQNIPLDELREHLPELPAGRPVYLYCGVGLRGYLASNILKENGFSDVRNLIGGLKTFKAATTPVCLPDSPSIPPEDGKTASPAAPMAEKETARTLKVDACGIQCPGPILKLKQNMETLQPGERLEIHATDPGFPRDAEAWCRQLKDCNLLA